MKHCWFYFFLRATLRFKHQVNNLCELHSTCVFQYLRFQRPPPHRARCLYCARANLYKYCGRFVLMPPGMLARGYWSQRGGYVYNLPVELAAHGERAQISSRRRRATAVGESINAILLSPPARPPTTILCSRSTTQYCWQAGHSPVFRLRENAGGNAVPYFLGRIIIIDIFQVA